VLRRIFGPERDEVAGEWRRLHNKELYALYSSANIIRVITPGRLRRAGYIRRVCVCVWGGVHAGFWWGNTGEGGHLEDPGVDGRIISKWIFVR
jgi:hypothetical protein